MQIEYAYFKTAILSPANENPTALQTTAELYCGLIDIRSLV